MALFNGLRSLLRPQIYVYGGDYGVRVSDMDAAMLYIKQPNLRAVISFLADNAAQVPIKVYERASDTDRPRVLDSPAALLLSHPNPDMTAFELKRWIYSDLLLYERCFGLLYQSKETESGWELRPIPNEWIQGYKGTNPFAPDAVTIGIPGETPIEVPREWFELFHGYNPRDPMRQCSKIQALKETLHEQIESNKFRRQMWHRGGRFNSYLTRPKDVQPWGESAFERFKETFKSSWAGSEAAEGGGMPILEDGMEIKTVQFNSKDAQWAEAVKLSREDCAAVYHVNPAMIWPGSGQTYASARDNARALYNDCLAPSLMQVTDRINMDILPRLEEPKLNYVGYDITVKTEGTYEEKISTLSSAVGAPFLSRNEARARLDLPAIEGGDDLITPLNVLVGGLSSPRDTDPNRERYNSINKARKELGLAPVKQERKTRGKPTDDEKEQITAVYRAFFKRQKKTVLAKLGAKADWWNEDRWNDELTDDLYDVAFNMSAGIGKEAASDLWGKDGDYNPEITKNYVKTMCRRRAEMVNTVTYNEIKDALDEKYEDEDALKATPEGVFENAEENRSVSAGTSFATALVAWAALEACQQNAQGDNVYKTWIVTSDNPRSSHAAMNGETVPYDEPFSNGAMWPCDIDNLDIEDVANCHCELEITIED